MQIASLYRYPVKGLSPEPLAKAELAAGQFFPGDRILAFENGPSGFDPERPAYQAKTRFLMLMKNARLAEVTSRFDDESGTLMLSHALAGQVRGDVRTESGRRVLESYLQAFCASEARGAVRLLQAPDGFRFTDSIRSGFVSILNLASVRDLEQRMGAAIDPLRFRANIAVEGWEPWVEETLPGQRLRLGATELRVLKTIDRCLATHVDPYTGLRDLDIVGALRSSFGRITCGVYASVKRGGAIEIGDAVAQTA